MKKTGPLPALVTASLAFACLCTLLLRDGWLVWLPLLLALVVVAKLWCSLGR